MRDLIFTAIGAAIMGLGVGAYVGWTRENIRWSERMTAYNLRCEQAVRDETEEMLARALQAQQYADTILQSVVMPIDIVHDGLPDPAPWDETALTGSHPNVLFGGEQTGIWPMVLELKDDESETVKPAGPEFPLLHENPLREPLTTAPEKVSPRSRFADMTFHITVPARELAGVA